MSLYVKINVCVKMSVFVTMSVWLVCGAAQSFEGQMNPAQFILNTTAEVEFEHYTLEKVSRRCQINT